MRTFTLLVLLGCTTLCYGQSRLIKSQGSGIYDEVFCASQDKKGIIWFGTREGVYCFNGTAFTHFLDDGRVINKAGLHLKMVDQNIWFGTRGMGLYRYNRKTLTRFSE
jgi:ligand-binding sensor domain-containing protein